MKIIYLIVLIVLLILLYLFSQKSDLHPSHSPLISPLISPNISPNISPHISPHISYVSNIISMIINECIKKYTKLYESKEIVEKTENWEGVEENWEVVGSVVVDVEEVFKRLPVVPSVKFEKTNLEDFLKYKHKHLYFYFEDWKYNDISILIKKSNKYYIPIGPFESNCNFEFEIDPYYSSEPIEFSKINIYYSLI